MLTLSKSTSFEIIFKSNTTTGEIIWVKILPKADFENNKRLIQAAAVQDIYSKRENYNEATGSCRVKDWAQRTYKTDQVSPNQSVEPTHLTLTQNDDDEASAKRKRRNHFNGFEADIHGHKNGWEDVDDLSICADYTNLMWSNTRHVGFGVAIDSVPGAFR